MSFSHSTGNSPKRKSRKRRGQPLGDVTNKTKSTSNTNPTTNDDCNDSLTNNSPYEPIHDDPPLPAGPAEDSFFNSDYLEEQILPGFIRKDAEDEYKQIPKAPLLNVKPREVTPETWSEDDNKLLMEFD